MRTIRERFEEKFVRRGPSDCWIWTAARRGPYGKIGIRRGKTELAHRLAYQLSKGPIPEGMVVCHSCDTPLCVNPGHLEVGTQLKNVRDMVRRGRSRCNITPEMAQSLRRMHKRRHPEFGAKALARKFDIEYQTVVRVVGNRSLKQNVLAGE